MKKEVMKGTIIGVLVGGIIFGSVGSVAAYNLRSNQITYQPTDSAWKVNNVEDAINSLYIAKTGDNYSTEERIVGTWIDGKPIYQKVITNLSISTSRNDWVKTNVGIKDMDYPINLICMRKGVKQIYTASRFFIPNTNGEIQFIIDDTDTVEGLIIQYTKTTDPIPGEEQSS